MKKIYTLLFIALTGASFGQYSIPHYDGFDYTGTALQTQVGWTALNTGDDIAISTGSLSYSGLPTSTGNKISFAGTGIDTTKAIATQTTGTVYYSFVLNISSMAGVTDVNGGYFAGLLQTTTTFGGTLWTKRVDDTNFNIGIEVRTANAANTTWTSTAYPTGQNIFVVVGYTFGAGAADDTVNLWINPTLPGTEPTPTLTDVHTGTDLTGISGILLRQDSATETPSLEIDELRIATTWNDVTTTLLANDSFSQIEGLKMYPNPTKNNLYIETALNSDINVSIVNIVGKEVVNTKAVNNTVNVANLTSGIYVVKITEEGKTSTKKLVIE